MQLRFSEVNYLNYTKKDPILHVATTFSLKQGETRTSHGPIPHPLKRYSEYSATCMSCNERHTFQTEDIVLLGIMTKTGWFSL